MLLGGEIGCGKGRGGGCLVNKRYSVEANEWTKLLKDINCALQYSVQVVTV